MPRLAHDQVTEAVECVGFGDGVDEVQREHDLGRRGQLPAIALLVTRLNETEERLGGALLFWRGDVAVDVRIEVGGCGRERAGRSGPQWVAPGAMTGVAMGVAMGVGTGVGVGVRVWVGATDGKRDGGRLDAIDA